MNHTLTTHPCAKINIGLYVTRRRPDGYHDLETVFCPIPLCDELTITLGGTADRLQLEGMALDGDPMDNLVMRAVRLLREEGHEVPPADIRLRKNIPSGAGLGGGSSDAAYTLRMLNQMLELGIPLQKMTELAARLGADCAFFTQDEPMFAEGIGDVLSPVEVNLDGLWLCLVKPDDFVSTREAYGGVTPRQPQHPLRSAIARPVDEWQTMITNDFEQSILLLHPAIAQVKQQMMRAGALYAAMSGSGSAVYGFFEQETKMETPFFQFVSMLQTNKRKNPPTV